MKSQFNWNNGLNLNFEGLFIISSYLNQQKFSSFFRNRVDGIYVPSRDYIPGAEAKYLQVHNLVLVLHESMDPNHTLWAENISAAVVYFNAKRGTDDIISIEYHLKETESDNTDLINFIEWLIVTLKEDGLDQELV